MIQKLWKRMTHKHNYIQVGFEQAESSYERYSIRIYKCSKCHKIKRIDGRLDDYLNRSKG